MRTLHGVDEVPLGHLLRDALPHALHPLHLVEQLYDLRELEALLPLELQLQVARAGGEEVKGGAEVSFRVSGEGAALLEEAEDAAVVADGFREAACGRESFGETTSMLFVSCGCDFMATSWKARQGAGGRASGCECVCSATLSARAVVSADNVVYKALDRLLVVQQLQPQAEGK